MNDQPPLQILKERGYEVVSATRRKHADWLWDIKLTDGRELGLCHHRFPINYWTLTTFSPDVDKMEASEIAQALREGSCKLFRAAG